jgi:UPF0755 protein
MRFLNRLLFGLLTAVLIWAGFWQFEQFLHSPLALTEVQELEVPRGSHLGLVARELAARDILRHPLWLRGYARLSGRGHSIHAGEYLIGPGTTPLDLLNMLERGEVRTFALTLVEGWTVSQARMALSAQPRLAQTLGDLPDQELLAALGIDETPGRQPEGLFFPDTYVFSGETRDRDILLQAYRRMQELLAAEWEKRSDGLPYDSPYQALIMASIVERETGVPDERGQIAGVFVRRLQQGMRLQTDPTVIYGMGSRFDGNLRRSDLVDAQNRYNTYAHAGLPPTPIALPGREAIRAALHPAAGETLYFVARGDGSHHFSVTLAEHEAAVRKYQIEKRRSDYRSRPPIKPSNG